MCVITVGLLKNMCYQNLICVPIVDNEEATFGSRHTMQPEHEQKQVFVYTRQELFAIRDGIQHDRHYKTLDKNACLNVRKLKINKRRKRGKRSGKQRKFKHQIQINSTVRIVTRSNLIKVNIVKRLKDHSKQVKIATVNARSIKNKDLLIVDYLKQINIDVCIVSETWLTEQDAVWLEGCELNKNGYKCNAVNREGRSGGGLAIVYKTQYRASQIVFLPTQTFEYEVWKLTLSDSEYIHLVGIYHPPPSKINPSNNSFIDEISMFLADKILQLSNIMIDGDFNIHVNETEKNNIISFNDTLEALGLDQHVAFPTHSKGNTLDLVFTECYSKVQVLECTQGSFISDHCAVICTTSLKKNKVSRERVTYRKIKDIDIDLLLDDMQLEDLLTSDMDINGLYNKFVDTAEMALNTHAPVKEKTITVREKNPWYGENLIEQKRTCRNRERIWKRYPQEHTWKALKVERGKYKKMLRKAKQDSISEKVIECGRDLKQLYKLVEHLTGTKADNALPCRSSNEDLANEFADFFISKIRKIRDNLSQYEGYVPTRTKDIPPLSQLEPLSEKEVENIVSKMATKSCELDALPTEIFKKGLNRLLPLVTKIVNTSLEHGVFALSWKTAIVRPLLKKSWSRVGAKYLPSCQQLELHIKGGRKSCFTML